MIMTMILILIDVDGDDDDGVDDDDDENENAEDNFAADRYSSKSLFSNLALVGWIYYRKSDDPGNFCFLMKLPVASLVGWIFYRKSEDPDGIFAL